MVSVWRRCGFYQITLDTCFSFKRSVPTRLAKSAVSADETTCIQLIHREDVDARFCTLTEA